MNYYWRVEHGHTPLGVLPTHKNASEAPSGRDDPRIHIGKRLACGFYCHACQAPLATLGVTGTALAVYTVQTTCPYCHATPAGYTEKTVSHRQFHAIAQATPPAVPTATPTGVALTAAFLWAQEGAPVIAACNDSLWRPLIEDETGALYSGQQFLALLDWGCGMQFFQCVGQWFN